MPNYVYTSMAVTGPAAEIARFKKECYDEKDNLSFNKIIPMPESLNVVSGGANDDAVLMYLTENGSKPFTDDLKKKFCEIVDYSEIGADGIVRKVGFPIDVAKTLKAVFNDDGSPKKICINSSGLRENSEPTHTFYEFGKILVENYTKYGATTWYEWSILNWGTKWNTCDFFEESCEELPDGNTVLKVNFSTAWAAPAPIFRVLAKNYPALKFEVLCEEEEGYGCSFTIENNVFCLEDITPWEDMEFNREDYRDEDMTEEEVDKAFEDHKKFLSDYGLNMAVNLACRDRNYYDKVLVSTSFSKAHFEAALALAEQGVITTSGN